MKLNIVPIALSLGLLVGGGVALEAHSTYLDGCSYFKMEASKAARARISPDSPGILGFAPMEEFNKVYIPGCAPEDECAELVGAVAGGGFTVLLVLFAGRLLAPLFNHKE